MIARWTRSIAGEGHAVPVELRFIDMFMATIGALIFMAMLFAWVIANLKELKPGPPPGLPPPGVVPLTLLTKALPPARIGQPYDVALAYRGGTAPYVWQVESGLNEIPEGMRFVDSAGAIRGMPTQEKTARFVVVLRDAAGKTVRQPYDLRIDPLQTTARNLEMFLFAAIVFSSLIWWRRTRKSARGWIQTVQALVNAKHAGQQRLRASVADGVEQFIELETGIKHYEEVRDGVIRHAGFLRGLTILLALVWMMRWLLR